MWRVHETECFPASFKINESDDKYAGDNDSRNFFHSRQEAQAEADKRNSITRCERCRKKLTPRNCTLITSICDDCLADQAADDRVGEQE